MARVHRLAVVLLSLLLLFVSSSWAAQCTEYSTHGGPWAPSKPAAAQAWFAAAGHGTYTTPCGGGFVRTVTVTLGQNDSQAWLDVSESVCSNPASPGTPANYSTNYDGYAVRNVTCNPCQSKAGNVFNGLTCNNSDGCKIYAQNLPPGSARTLCDVPETATGNSGCQVLGDRIMKAYGSDGQAYEWLGNIRYTGNECTVGEGGSNSANQYGNPNTPGSTAPAPLTPGKCPGTVNGVEVVVDCDRSITPSPTSTTSTTTTSTTPNPPSTDTTSKDVTIEKNGETWTKTTTTTITKTDGSVTTKTDVQTGDKGTICKGETNIACVGNGGDGSRFGGTCQTAFTCDGDAVQCATARAVNEHKCLMERLNQPTTESGLYDAEKDKAGNVTGDLPGNATMNIGASSFDTTDAIGGAQCIQNLSVTVWNRTLVLPLSDICTQLAHLGTVLVAVSFLLAARIVSRG